MNNCTLERWRLVNKRLGDSGYVDGCINSEATDRRSIDFSRNMHPSRGGIKRSWLLRATGERGSKKRSEIIRLFIIVPQARFLLDTKRVAISPWFPPALLCIDTPIHPNAVGSGFRRRYARQGRKLMPPRNEINLRSTRYVHSIYCTHSRTLTQRATRCAWITPGF